MVHFGSRKKKINLEMIDKVSNLLGWKTLISKPNERIYVIGNLKVKFIKINSGYKTLMIRNEKVRNTDVDKNLDVALTSLGEALMYREW